MKPVLFNTDMVRAILEGRKTVTRRILKPANSFRAREYRQGDGLWIDGYNKDDAPNGHIKDYSVSDCWLPKEHYIKLYAPYKVDDTLYVRETWGKYGDGTQILYKADYPDRATKYTHDDGIHKCDLPKWKPSIHMPKDFSRIFLKVTSVKIERLQDMKLQDFLKEGIIIREESFNDPDNAYFQAQNIFQTLWNSTMKKDQHSIYGWDANPYVWEVEFERLSKKKGEDV